MDKHLYTLMTDSAAYSYAPCTPELLHNNVPCYYKQCTYGNSRVISNYMTGKVEEVAVRPDHKSTRYGMMSEMEYAGAKASFYKRYGYRSSLHMRPEDFATFVSVSEMDAQLRRAFKVATDFCNTSIDVCNLEREILDHDVMAMVVLQAAYTKNITRKIDIDIVRDIKNATQAKKIKPPKEEEFMAEAMYIFSHEKNTLSTLSQGSLEAVIDNLDVIYQTDGNTIRDRVVHLGNNSFPLFSETFDKNTMQACLERYHVPYLQQMGADKAEEFWTNMSALNKKDTQRVYRAYEIVHKNQIL